jgi:hypothetical protein
VVNFTYSPPTLKGRAIVPINLQTGWANLDILGKRRVSLALSGIRPCIVKPNPGFVQEKLREIKNHPSQCSR